MAHTQSIHFSRNGIGAVLRHVVEAVEKATARGRAYRQTMRELNELSDRDLADLRLTRSMIKRVATEAAEAK